MTRWNHAFRLTPLAALPNVMVTSPERGWKTVADVVAAAKAKPGQLNYASAGVGSATHLNAEKFKMAGQFFAVHIPFTGSAGAVSEVMAGRLDYYFSPISPVIGHIKEGRLVALAVGSPRRAAALPDVPTMAEAGVPGYEANFTLVLFAPRGVPEAVVGRFRQAFLDAVKTPEVVDKLKASDQTVVGNTPAQAAAVLAADSVKWGAVARKINLGMD